MGCQWEQWVWRSLNNGQSDQLDVGLMGICWMTEWLDQWTVRKILDLYTTLELRGGGCAGWWAYNGQDLDNKVQGSCSDSCLWSGLGNKALWLFMYFIFISGIYMKDTRKPI